MVCKGRTPNPVALLEPLKKREPGDGNETRIYVCVALLLLALMGVVRVSVS